jgi:hypothetical protein
VRHNNRFLTYFCYFQLVVFISVFLAVSVCKPPSTVVLVVTVLIKFKIVLTASSSVPVGYGNWHLYVHVNKKVESRILPPEIAEIVEVRGEAVGPNRKVILPILA